MSSFTICSWNTCKKGRSEIASVVRRMRAQLGDVVGLLQEIPAWGSRAGYTYHNHTLLSADGSDCGFLIPRHWMPALRCQLFRPYWAACVLGRTIFVSAHMLDHTEEYGRCSAVIHESIDFISRMKQQYGIIFNIVLGVDANVTFPANLDDISGNQVLQAAKTHTPAMTRPVLAWFEALGIRALNTYFSAECYTEGELNKTKLWTCGTKRRLHKRTQIDFVGVSPGITGKAYPVDFEGKLFKRSDHRPLAGFVHLQRWMPALPVLERSLKGWRPDGEEQRNEFGRRCLEFLSSDLIGIQTSVVDVAREIPHSTAGSRQWNERLSINGPIKQTRRRVAESRSVLGRAAAVKQLRQAVRQAQQSRGDWRLSTTSRPNMKRRLPMSLKVNGILSCDRKLWVQEATDFSKRRFGNPANNFSVQNARVLKYAKVSEILYWMGCSQHA